MKPIIYLPGTTESDLERAIRSSAIKVFNDMSPAHCRARYYSGHPTTSSESQEFGTAVHCLMLEPGEFDRRYVVLPDADIRTTAGALTIANALADAVPLPRLYPTITEETAPGKLELIKTHIGIMREWLKLDGVSVISEETRAKAINIADHALSIPAVRRILEHPLAVAEETTVWIESSADFAPCRMTPDVYIPPCDEFPRGLMGDVKTAIDASPRAFLGIDSDGRARGWYRSAAHKYKYHWQAALYVLGFEHRFGARPLYVWIVPETADQPDGSRHCALYRCPEWIIQRGLDEIEPLLGQMGGCVNSGVWPSYDSDFVDPIDPSSDETDDLNLDFGGLE